MKIAKYISLAAAAGLLWAGCSSDLDEVRVSADPTPAVLKSHEPIVITEENLNDESVFQWSAADFGYDAAVEYQLFGRVSGGTAARVLSANGLSGTITNSELNDWLQNVGVETGATAEVALYVVASISSAYSSVNSNEVTVSMSGYDANKSIYEYIYMPGNHQGWNPAEAPTLRPVDTNGNYDGLLALYTGGEETMFKFTGGPSWDINWGGTLANLVPNGDNITELAEGFYRIQLSIVDWKATATLFSHISIMGSIEEGNGWANDIQLAREPDNNYLWSVTGDFIAGEYKFRFNNDWSFNLGGSLNHLTEGGDNLKLDAAGRYKITLDLSAYPYTGRVESL